MKIGIISFAHMHAFSYARAIAQMPDVELVGVSDEDEARGQGAAEAFHTRYFRDYQELLKQDVDAVIICSENVKHADIAVAAAEAKKHVLCEKPIATTVEDAWRMIDACEKNGVQLHTAFPQRFSPSVKQMKKLIDSGDLGRVVSMVGTNRGQNPGGWFVDLKLSGGGAVLDHTVHILDIMRYLTNSEVREVYAQVGTRFTDSNFDDCGLLMLEFANGVYASHDPSWSRPPKSFPTWGDVTLEVVGTNGVSYIDTQAQRFPYFNEKQGKMVNVDWGDDLDFALVRDFIHCVREGKPPFVSGLDGLRAMEVALAAYESGRTGKPVKLNAGAR